LTQRASLSGNKNLKLLTILIFLVTMFAIATLAVQLEVIEIKEGSSGSGSGSGGGEGPGEGEGEGAGAGEATTASAGGEGGAGEYVQSDIGFDPGAGGSSGIEHPEESPQVETPKEDPESEPDDKGFFRAGRAIAKDAEFGKGVAGGKGGAGNATPGGGGGGGGSGRTGVPQIVLPEKVKWLLIAIVMISMLATVSYMAKSYMKARKAALKKRTRAKKKKKKKARVPEALVKAIATEFIETIEMTYDSLAGMEDIKKAIRLCYRRLCTVISDKGLSRSPDLTPREFYRTCSENFKVRSASMRKLTVLFEEAVFSEHPMGEAHRNKGLKLLKGAVKEVEKW